MEKEEINLTAMNEYLKGYDKEELADIAESLSIAATDIAYRALVDNCGGVAGDGELEPAIYKIYQLSRIFKQLANDNK